MVALGAVELNGVATGIAVADAMCKTAKIRLMGAYPVCPGKYVVLVSGEVAAVRAAVHAGEQESGATLVDSFVIPNLHEQIFPAITGTVPFDEIQAVGIVETFSLASAVVVADHAVKAAAVTLLEVRLGRALGGKSFVLLTGEVAAVRAAITAGEKAVRSTGLLLGSVVIPSPHPDLIENLV